MPDKWKYQEKIASAHTYGMWPKLSQVTPPDKLSWLVN